MHVLRTGTQGAPGHRNVLSLQGPRKRGIGCDDFVFKRGHAGGHESLATPPQRAGWMQVELQGSSSQFLVDGSHRKNAAAAVEVCTIAGQELLPGAFRDALIEDQVEQVRTRRR